MEIALCHDKVFPARGGCETYIADLARRLVADGHGAHLYATDWDADALPARLQTHRLRVPPGPRSLRPWSFSAVCRKALRATPQRVSVAFGKVAGVDVLYPQGGLHAASFEHNLGKFRSPLARAAARAVKAFDLAHRSYAWFEQRQYLGSRRPLAVAISDMVQAHFWQYYRLPPDEIPVVRAAIDPARFRETDRLKRRAEWRQGWEIGPDETVGLFVAMNYELKGIRPLLRALAWLPRQHPFRLLVVGQSKTGPYERLASRLGVAPRVRFAGPCRDIRNCYFAADFLVHPTFYDPCSLVVLEALACGLPVITSRFNGAAELMTHGREGYIMADPHRHEELAAFMAQLLDPVNRSACAQAARRAAARWTFEAHYRQLLEILRLAQRRKSAASPPVLAMSA